MEQTPGKPKRRFQLPAQFAPVGFMMQEVTRDKDAFRILIACTLAMVTTGLEPAFLTLSTSEIQNRLRTPGSHAPMYIALVFAVLTLIAGTTGDMFGRKRVMVFGLAGLTLANSIGALTLGTPLFVVTDVLASISVLAVLPMGVAIATLIFPLNVRPLAYGMLFGTLGTAIIVGASVGGLFDALGIPAVAFILVVIVGVIALRQVVRYIPESRASKAFRRASAVVNLLLLAIVFVLIYFVIVGRSFFETWMPVLLAAGVLLVMVVCVRWLRRRVRFFSDVEMFTGRDTGFAIFAGVVLSSMLVTQLADFAFLKPLAQAGVSHDTLMQIKADLPSIFARTASSVYPNVPQAVLDLASAKYDQTFATGMGQMFLVLAGLMFLTAAAIYLGMHRGLRAAARPPLIGLDQRKDTSIDIP